MTALTTAVATSAALAIDTARGLYREGKTDKADRLLRHAAGALRVAVKMDEAPHEPDWSDRGEAGQGDHHDESA